jgi:transmembrane sensor
MTDDREQPDLDPQWQALARFLAGESPPEEQERIRAQLDGNADRAALVTALDAALARPDERPLSPHEVEAALASVMARRAPAADRAPVSAADVIPLAPHKAPNLQQARQRWRSSGLRAAAAVLLVAGASFFWRASRATTESASSAGGTASASIAHQTRAGQVDTVRLADGSSVVLGPLSRLRLANDFGRGAREVALEGQAYFDVAHDDAHPFLVRTPNATLRDVGTTFSVRSDSIAGTRVVVTSGAVDVAATRATASAPTLLHAGDMAEVAGERIQVERGAATDAELSWTRGILSLHDAPLSTVAQELRRWYGVKLVVTDSTIASRRLTATFERTTADEVGRVLAAVLGGSVTRSGDTLRLGVAGPR